MHFGKPAKRAPKNLHGHAPDALRCTAPRQLHAARWYSRFRSFRTTSPSSSDLSGPPPALGHIASNHGLIAIGETRTWQPARRAAYNRNNCRPACPRSGASAAMADPAVELRSALTYATHDGV